MARGIVAYFINGPKKGETEIVEGPGRTIVVDVMPPMSLRAVVSDTPLPSYDDVVNARRYVYVPVSSYMTPFGVAVWNYACEESKTKRQYNEYKNLSNAIGTRCTSRKSKPRKYKVVRRPKFEAR